jgi:hypothetical protein
MKVEGAGLPKNPAAEVRKMIVSIWQRTGATSVGEQELGAIQGALGEEISPASIARELASAGAALRHPEVIECDARWREGQVAKHLNRFADLTLLQHPESLTLSEAETAIVRLEALRVQSAVKGDELTLGEIRELAIDARQCVLNLANEASSSSRRSEHAEIAEWFRVWLETPQLFAQWVELRKASDAFANNFPAD